MHVISADYTLPEMPKLPKIAEIENLIPDEH
jgi:hypothetical protein